MKKKSFIYLVKDKSITNLNTYLTIFNLSPIQLIISIRIANFKNLIGKDNWINLGENIFGSHYLVTIRFGTRTRGLHSEFARVRTWAGMN